MGPAAVPSTGQKYFLLRFLLSPLWHCLCSGPVRFQKRKNPDATPEVENKTKHETPTKQKQQKTNKQKLAMAGSLEIFAGSQTVSDVHDVLMGVVGREVSRPGGEISTNVKQLECNHRATKQENRLVWER